jgi:hypothetical protein
MAPKGIKLSQRKHKAKVVEYMPRKGGRRTRYVPMEVNTFDYQQTPRRDTAAMETDNHDTILHEANPLSMDIDEALWIDEPDVPQQKRVSSLTCSSLTPFDVALSPSAPTWKSLFLRSTPT